MPIYMKYEGIVGPVKGKHAGWIQLESCQLDHGRGGAGAGDTVHVSEIAITKLQDSASTALFREAMSGTGKKVTIDFVNGDGVAYLTLQLENTMIAGLNLGGTGGAAAYESMSLNFAKISYVTKPAGPAADANPRNTQAVWNTATP